MATNSFYSASRIRLQMPSLLHTRYIGISTWLCEIQVVTKNIGGQVTMQVVTLFTDRILVLLIRNGYGLFLFTVRPVIAHKKTPDFSEKTISCKPTHVSSFVQARDVQKNKPMFGTASLSLMFLLQPDMSSHTSCFHPFIPQTFHECKLQ
jgi:hypothetical protein